MKPRRSTIRDAPAALVACGAGACLGLATCASDAPGRPHPFWFDVGPPGTTTELEWPAGCP